VREPRIALRRSTVALRWTGHRVCFPTLRGFAPGPACRRGLLGAAGIEPSNAEVHYSLCTCYQAAGKRAEAAQASRLLRILDEDLEARFPDSRSVNEALRALLAIEAALPKRKPRQRAA
jgi:hypothetical protein